MSIISQSISDYADMYTGLDDPSVLRDVGLGVVNPNQYATPEYQEKKIDRFVIGGITESIYAAFDTDAQPLVLAMAWEPAYNTILGINLRYFPSQIRANILTYVLRSNEARIRANQPIVIDYRTLKRAVPQVRGGVRRYKNAALRANTSTGDGLIPLVEWPEVVERRSPFERIYLEGM